MPTMAEIAIVGAGPGGLTAALALSLRGHKVSVFEQANKISEIGAGLQVSSNGGYVLKALGLFDDLNEIATAAKAVELFDYSSNQRVAFVDLEKYGSGPPHLMVHRHDLILLLKQKCRNAGVEINLGEKLLSIASSKKPEFVTTKAHRKADLLVCADGVHSIGRQTVVGISAPVFTRHVAWRSLVPSPGIHPDVARIYMGPKKHVVSYPLRGSKLINLVMVEERDVWIKECWSEKGKADDLKAIFASFKGEISDLLAKVKDPHIWGLFRHPVANIWSKGNVVLLGDAAHPTLPFMAQGANLAIEDAWVLAQSLSVSENTETGLLNYQAKRLPRVRRIVAEAQKNAWKYHLSFPPLRWAAQSAMRAASNFAPRQMAQRFDWIYGHDVTLPD